MTAKIIQENPFEHKKKKPGLSANWPSNNSAQVIDSPATCSAQNAACRFYFPNSDHMRFSNKFVCCHFFSCAAICTCIARYLTETAF